MNYLDSQLDSSLNVITTCTSPAAR